MSQIPLLNAWPGGLSARGPGGRLDRYGHLFEGHDDELRERLDAMHAQGLRAVPAGELVELPAAQARPVAAPARPTADQATKKTRRGGGPDLG